MNELKIPKGWQLKKISDTGKIITGSTPKTTHPEYYGNDFPFYGPPDLGSKIEIFDSHKGLTQKGLDVSRKIPEDSILVQCIGDLGRSSIIKKNGACNQQINVIIPNLDLVIPKFLYYWINSNFFRNLMIQHATQTTIANLNKTKFSNLPFFEPVIKTQKKIVTKLDHLLGELEEKKKQILYLIEQNKERIDFFEDNWLSYIIDTEIEHHPQRKEWNLTIVDKEIDDFEKRNPEKNPEKKFKYVEISSVTDNKKIKNFRTLLGKNAPSRARNVIRENDVIYGTTRPYYRNVVLIPKDFDDEICSTGFCVLRSNSLIPQFLFYFMLSNSANSQILKPMRGGNYPAVRNSDVTSITIPVPPLKTQKQIVQNIKNAKDKFQSQKEQFDKIKESYESRIKYIKCIQSSILDSAFSGKLVN